ncbi:DHS-like NAD/FAD-binding domain-containing protein [Mortierella sp. GBAus27b]|nr:DHS-like NAD/FAD-binding domain-containing protein [Mortierella sp. GBAus27b]
MAATRATKPKVEPEPAIRILKDGTVDAVAEYINEGKAKNIIVLSGAGISTAAGIKDFRSPGTGLYDDLKRFNLPYPEAVFDMAFFRRNPDPFYRLAKELLPGRYRPTLTHYLSPLLAKKGLLLRSYTQNIDMLDRLAGLNEDLLVEAHGSFATSKCIKCDVLSDTEWVRQHILNGGIPNCKRCGGLVKPSITFFGEALPPRFGELVQVDFEKCDLLIVMGTSLQVEPFSRLITKVPAKCPRILINRDRAGEFNYSGFDFDGKWSASYLRDALYLGSCDDGVRKLAELCGWDKELQELYETGHKELRLIDEMETLALEKKEKENKKKDGDDDQDEEDDKDTDDKKQAVQTSDSGLDEITQLLESTELSATKTETVDGQTTTTTTTVKETIIVETQAK